MIAAYGVTALGLALYLGALARERRALREALSKSPSGDGKRDAG